MRILLIVLFALTVSGCALTEFARDYLDNMVDVNQYEIAKDIDSAICEPDVLARLQKTRTREWYLATVKDCQTREEQAIPLSN